MRILVGVILPVVFLTNATSLIAQVFEFEKFREIPLDLGDEIVGKIVDVHIDKTGRFYMADEQQHTIWIIDREGKLIGRIGQEGSGPGDLLNPNSTAVLNGKIFVLDAGNDRISVFSEDGHILQSFRIDGQAGGIVTDGDRFVALKNLWDASLVTVYDMDGTEKEKWGSQSPDFWGLALGSRYITTTPEGQILTSDPKQYSVLRMDWDGNVLGRYTAASPGFGAFERPPGMFINLPDVLKVWTPMSAPLAVGGQVLAQWQKISITSRTESTTRYFGDLFTMDGEPVQLAIELPMQFHAVDGELLYGIDSTPVDQGETNPHILVYRLTGSTDR